MARDYLTDECLKFLDAKKLAEMRKGNFWALLFAILHMKTSI